MTTQEREALKTVVSITLASLLIVFIVYSWIYSTLQIPSYASIKTVGVEAYWNAALTEPTTEINWGMLELGENKTVRIYLKTTSNVPTTLNLSTNNWQPENASLYITLSWNYNGIVLNPSDVLPVDLTLAVSPTIEGITNFSFDIVITAQG